MRGCKDKSHTAQLVSGVAEPDAARDVETAAVRGDGAVVGGGDSGAGAGVDPETGEQFVGQPVPAAADPPSPEG